MSKDSGVRLDKWLWAARFYKTRSLASQMVQGGKVHFNGQRCKASRTVEVGVMLTLWQGNEEKEIEILAIDSVRRGAPQAQLLYRETEASIARREQRQLQRQLQPQMPRPETKPDKKQRRQLLDLKSKQ